MYITNNIMQIAIAIAIAIAIGGILVGGYGTILVLKRDNKDSIDKRIADENKRTETMTTISVKLDAISNNVKDLTFDIKDLKNDIKNQDTRLVKVEESVAFAHERLDKIEEK